MYNVIRAPRDCFLLAKLKQLPGRFLLKELRQVETKTCTICKETKQKNEFYQYKSRKDGYSSYCKSCKKEMKKNYMSTKDYKDSRKKSRMKYRGKYPERRQADNAVYRAVQRGELPKVSSLSCEVCGTQAEEYHHYKGYDPEHHLDVLPLCVQCHREEDKKLSN